MILISISSLSQLSMFERLGQRLIIRYPDLVFVTFGCNEYQNEIIRKSAEKLGVKFDSQIPIYNSVIIEDLKNKVIPELNWLDKLLYNFKSKSYVELTDILNSRKKIYLNNLKEDLISAKHLLNKYTPKVVLVAEDGVSGNCSLIKQANNQKIPVVNIPYEVSGIEDFVNLINDNIKSGNAIEFDAHCSQYHEYLYKHFNKWVLKLDLGDFLLFPPELIMARLESGLDLPNPWTTHGGNSDILAVESNAMLEHYRKEKIDESKLKVVGSVYCDVISDSMHSDSIYNKAYINKTKIKSDKTSVLVSIPPTYHGTRPYKNEFDTYNEMLNQVFKLMRDINLDVTVSLHPAIPVQDFELIRSYDVQIADEWLISLIPKNDIFFVISFSSSIRWAISCGKPVINYDAYAHNLKVYDQVPNFYNYRKLEDVKLKLENLKNTLYYEQVAESLSVIRQDWGNLEGNNFSNIYNLFEKYL